MMNIKLTPEQYMELRRWYVQDTFLPIAPLLETGVFLFCGRPVYTLDDGGALIYIRCEYCGLVDCECGAPLEMQGRYLDPGEDIQEAVEQMEGKDGESL